MKTKYYWLIGLLLVFIACDDDKDKSDYEGKGEGVPTGLTVPVPGNITMVSAEFTASVEDPNGCTITENGFVISENSKPTIENIISAAEQKSTGTFTATAVNLAPGTTYYARAYSLNCMGVAYSENEISFTTAPHPLAAFIGKKSFKSDNYVLGETETLTVNLAIDDNDLSVLYLTGLQSSQVTLALGKIKMLVNVETGQVTIPAGQQVKEDKYGTYQYVYLDENLDPVMDQDITGHIDENTIVIDDVMGALIIVGGNAGLFHSVYGNVTIQ